MKLRDISFWSALAVVLFMAAGATVAASIADGPYVLERVEDRLVAQWIAPSDAGRQVQRTLVAIGRQVTIPAVGVVHLLLGNHEAMARRGDLRCLNPKYLETAKVLRVESYAELFGPQTLLGQRLRSKPAVLPAPR